MQGGNFWRSLNLGVQVVLRNGRATPRSPAGVDMNEYAGCQVTNDVEIGADDIEPSLTAFLEIDKEEISGGEAGKNRI